MVVIDQDELNRLYENLLRQYSQQKKLIDILKKNFFLFKFTQMCALALT